MASLSQEDLNELSPAGAIYERHRPEETLLYQIIEKHWPRFQEHLERQGKQLPAYVIQEFEEYLKCGCLKHGFLRVACETCHAEKLVAFSCRKRGFCHRAGHDAWQIVPHIWWTKSSLNDPFGNGC